MQAQSVIQPKKPKGKKWKPMLIPKAATCGYPGKGYFHKPTRLFVISAVESARQQKGMERECSYHVSVSKNSNRCSPEEAEFVLREFGMEGAEEDNHVPGGIVRNFWLPVAENLIGKECPCKQEETAIVEDKGSYLWRPVSG